ncbi:MAG: hypothetical protein K2Y29_15245, partial [Beijerinckiaceae bacterium]|nr:hypothetical protein [Beijerinckiaceae bacterium]
APQPQPRPVRVARTVIVDDEPIYVGRPAPIYMGAGVVLAPPRGGVRPRPGHGWRPPGALPPPVSGRQPVAPRPQRKPSSVGALR